MFTNTECRLARKSLAPEVLGRVDAHAQRRGISADDAMLELALEGLQRQLYALRAKGRRLSLVKG